MASDTTPPLADRLRASSDLIDSGGEAAAERALDLQVAVEIGGARLMKIAGAMSDRQIAGEVEADRQHVGRIRSAIADLRQALDTFEARQ